MEIHVAKRSVYFRRTDVIINAAPTALLENLVNATWVLPTPILYRLYKASLGNVSPYKIN